MTMTFTEPDFPGLSRVISGGQTGADRGGIEAAFALHVETGGHAPQGWRTSRGPATELASYGLVEDISAAYPPRTRLNAKNSDATAIIGTQLNSPGSALTFRLCKQFGRPCKMIGLTAQYTNEQLLVEAKNLANFIRAKKVRTLNVAGNRDGYDNLHLDMTFKLIQATLLDLYFTGDLVTKGVQ